MAKRAWTKHQTLSWLRCDLDAKETHVVSLYCSICRKYEAYIHYLKNFRKDWIEGSTNQRTSNLMHHATSDVHKAKLKVKHSRAMGESAATMSTIGRLLSLVDDKTWRRMTKKFNVCFMPWSWLGPSLPHTRFSEVIYKLHCEEPAPGLPKCAINHAFFSFLMDGTTDVGNQEDELIVPLYCSKDATAQEITPGTCYLSIHSPEKKKKLMPVVYSCVWMRLWNLWVWMIDLRADQFLLKMKLH